MKRIIFLTVAGFLAAGTCIAQARVAATRASDLQETYNAVKSDLLKAAEETPDADFQYAPTTAFGSVAHIVNHITEAQFHTCSMLNGTTANPKDVPSDMAPKAAILAGLKASFVACDKAYGAITNATAAERVDAGHGSQQSRRALAWENVSRDNEQYGELATYMSLAELKLPSSGK